MPKNLILVNTSPDILRYDNRKAIELAQTLGRPLTASEYETLKIKKPANPTQKNVVKVKSITENGFLKQ
jgi:hypothetical protein